MRFRRWWVTLFTALGLVLTGSLGVWQMNRAQQKLAQQAELEAAGRRALVDGAELLARPEGDWAQRPALLRGRWLPAQQVWLDNRPHERRVGTLLLTPLQLDGQEAVVWVQRGWQERAPGVHGLPPWPDSPTGIVTVTGRLAPQASRAYEMGTGASGPLRQNLDLAATAHDIGRPVLPWVLWQTGPACAPLSCNWPAPDSGVHKHWGYAAQWFALMALILGLYVWFQFLKPTRAAG